MTAARGTRGFTLIELMVSVALSGLVIAFIFQIHGQMSNALRGQAAISEVNESLAAARDLIAREIRSAGMGFPPNGIKTGPLPEDVLIGIAVRDDATDAVDPNGDIADFLEIQRIGGEPVEVNRIEDTSVAGYWKFWVVPPGTRMPHDQRPEFQAPAGLVITNGGNTLACRVLPGDFAITTDGFEVLDDHFLSGGNCEGIVARGDPATARFARLEMIAFRLDEAASTLDLGVLERFENGAWQDIGIGFTNFQVAVRYREIGDLFDLDGDGDPELDWYSGGLEMQPGFSGRTPGVPDVPVQIGFSLEARNTRRIDGVASSATPPLGVTDPNFVKHNPYGNFAQDCSGAQYDPCGTVLPNNTIVRYSYPGRIYRATHATVWLRTRLGWM